MNLAAWLSGGWQRARQMFAGARSNFAPVTPAATTDGPYGPDITLPGHPKRLPPPREPVQSTYEVGPAKLASEYVAGGQNLHLGQYLRVLPAWIDQLTRDFGDDLYERMMLDDQVESSVYGFTSMVLSEDVVIRPAIDDKGKPDFALAKEITEFCEQCLDGLARSLDETLEEMALATILGNEIAEQVYEPIESGRWAEKLALKLIKVKPRRSTGFVTDAYMNVVGLRAIIPGKSLTVGMGSTIIDPALLTNVIQRKKFAILTWRMRNGDPRGTSIGRAAYQAWWEKQQIGADYLRFLAQFASPSVWGTVGPDAIPELPMDGDGNVTSTVAVNPVQALLSALLQWKNGTAMALPHGAQLNTLFSGGTGEAFISALDRQDRRIARAILLSTRATMESQHGSKADSETAQDVTGNPVKYARRVIARMITQDVLYPLVEYNWGEGIAKRLCPKAALSPIEHQDWPDVATAASTLVSSGLVTEPMKALLCEKIGLPPYQAAPPEQQGPPGTAPAGPPGSSGGPGGPTGAPTVSLSPVQKTGSGSPSSPGAGSANPFQDPDTEALQQMLGGEGTPFSAHVPIMDPTFADQWTAFVGPRGGKGWKNSRTQEVLYQEAHPGERGQRVEYLGHQQGDARAEVGYRIPLTAKTNTKDMLAKHEQTLRDLLSAPGQDQSAVRGQASEAMRKAVSTRGQAVIRSANQALGGEWWQDLPAYKQWRRAMHDAVTTAEELPYRIGTPREAGAKKSLDASLQEVRIQFHTLNQQVLAAEKSRPTQAITQEPSNADAVLFPSENHMRDRIESLDNYDAMTSRGEIANTVAYKKGQGYTMDGKSLSESELKALEHYTGAGYAAINHWLRSDKETRANPESLDSEHRETLVAMKKLFAQTKPSEKPVNVYRGLRLDPTQTSTLLAQLKQAHASQEPVRFAGYSSATFDPAIATAYGAEGKLQGKDARAVKGGAGNDVLFEISARKGLNIGDLSADDPQEGQWSESEMLLDHDSRMRVAGIREVPFKDPRTGETSKRVVVQMVQLQ